MPYPTASPAVRAAQHTLGLAAVLLIVGGAAMATAQEPAPATGQTTGEMQAPQAQPELPPGEHLIDLFIEASGEADASADIDTVVQKGTIEFVGMGLSGNIVISIARPDKMLTRFNIAGLGTVTSGSGDGIAWEVSDVQGPRVITGSERAFIIRSSQIDGFAHWRDFYSNAETVGIEEVDGTTCYVVEMTPTEGNSERWFLDTEGKLLRKMSLTMSSPLGEIPVESSFEEYTTDPKGITRPWRSSQKVLGQHMRVVIESVEYNLELEPGLFEPPEQVQALLERGQETQEEKEAAPPEGEAESNS